MASHHCAFFCSCCGDCQAKLFMLQQKIAGIDGIVTEKNLNSQGVTTKSPWLISIVWQRLLCTLWFQIKHTNINTTWLSSRRGAPECIQISNFRYSPLLNRRHVSIIRQDVIPVLVEMKLHQTQVFWSGKSFIFACFLSESLQCSNSWHLLILETLRIR